jgi:hypothetical protein
MTLTRKEAALAFLCLASFFVLFMSRLGTVAAGPQFTEDYEIFEIRDRIDAGAPLPKLMMDLIQRDQFRFRIYYPVRVLQIALLGTNVPAIRFSIALLGVFTAFFLYLFMRGMRFSSLESFLLIFLTLLGTPFSIWWRMGTAENLGLFFMSLSLCCVLWRRDVLYVVFMILMSLSKESFIVILPALLYFRLWIIQSTGEIDRRTFLTRNGWIVGLLVAACAAELIFIKRVTGTVAAGYAGFDGFHAELFWKAAQNQLLAGYIWILLPLLVVMLILMKTTACNYSILSKITGPIAFGFAFIVPLILLFQKSGLQRHYVLPGAFALVFLTIYFLREIRPYFKGFAYKIFVAVILCSILARMQETKAIAASFTQESKIVGNLFSAVRDSTSEGDTVLIVADAARQLEWSYATKQYLERLSGRKNILFFPIMRRNYSEFEKFLLTEHHDSVFKTFKGRIFTGSGAERIHTIVVLPQEDLLFRMAAAGWFDTASYNRTAIDQFALYTRKPVHV